MPDPDLAYEPGTDVVEFVTRVGAEGLLFMGDPDSFPAGGSQALLSIGVEVRFTVSAQAKRFGGLMPSGLYAVKSRGAWFVLVHCRGKDATRAREESSSYIADELDPLLIASDFIEDWDDATVLTPEDVLLAGTYFRRRGGNDYGLIVGHKRIQDQIQYTVDVRGERLTLGREEIELVEGDPMDPLVWLEAPPAGPDEMRLTLAWNKLRHPLTDVLYSYRASRTLFRPYQFKPILKMMNGFDQRILIADEVGLGKTIEAGLVWSELQGRSSMQRVLVVCPSSLTLKWQTEMRRRFDRRLDNLDAAAWERFLLDYEGGQQEPLLGVVSMERLRMLTNVMERIIDLGVRFDLVIIDEAHRMRNPGNRTHEMGETLASAADALVLLTATPVNLGNRDLFTLLQFLDPAQFTSSDMFEAQARPNAIVNMAAAMLVREHRPTEVRERLLSLKDDPLGHVILDRPDVQALLETLGATDRLSPRQLDAAKRVMAGMGPFSNYISRTRKKDVPDAKAVRFPVTLSVEWTQEEQDFYDAVRTWTRDRALREGHPPGFIEQMPLRQTASCIPAMIRRLQTPEIATSDEDYLAESDQLPGSDFIVPKVDVPAPRRDTKYEKLLEALTQVREAGFKQVIIFSYFRLTLQYLSERLSSEGLDVRVMHGGVSPVERDAIQRDFRSGAFEILLMSEVGSEGLDFEFCGALVNYDLPWNPMRVEQRIGRLDRFGQKHERIHIYNFSVSGTVEDRILLRLYDRIRVFEASIGELEPILADIIDDLQQVLVSPQMTDSERAQRALEIEVALEAKDHVIQQLREHEGSLTSLDNLLIDGFEDDNPGRGRYVSSSELLSVVSDLCRRTDAQVSPLPDDKAVIRSSVKLADEVGRQQHSDAAMPIDNLLARLYGKEEVTVGFNPETLVDGEVLLTVRHPLVRAGIRLIDDDPGALKRFGHVALSSRPTSQAVAAISLLEFSGVRDSLELSASIVAADGRPLDGMVDDLFQSLTSNTSLPGSLVLPPNLDELFALVDDQADRERLRRQSERSIHDEAFRAERRAAIEHSYEMQRSQVERRLQSSIDERIVRLHRGRLRNLQAQRDQKVAGLATKSTTTTRKLLSILVLDY